LRSFLRRKRLGLLEQFVDLVIIEVHVHDHEDKEHQPRITESNSTGGRSSDLPRASDVPTRCYGIEVVLAIQPLPHVRDIANHVPVSGPRREVSPGSQGEHGAPTNW